MSIHCRNPYRSLSRKNSWVATLAACSLSVLAIFIYTSAYSLFPPFSTSMLEDFFKWNFIQISLVCALITNLYGYYILVFGKGEEAAIDGHGGPFLTMLCVIIFSMAPFASLKFEPLGFMLVLVAVPYYFALRYIYTDLHRIYGSVH